MEANPPGGVEKTYLLRDTAETNFLRGIGGDTSPNTKLWGLITLRKEGGDTSPTVEERGFKKK